MLTTYRNAFRLFNRDVRLYLIAWALLGFAYVGIFMVLFNLYLLRLGYGPAFIGLINALAQMATALFSLPAGALGRRWGSRRMLIVGVIGAGLSLGLLPLAELIPAAWQSGWLTITYVSTWLVAALLIVNSNPFLMGVTSPEERDHAFSVREALFPLAAFGGSLAGGLLPGFFAATSGLSLTQPAPYRYALFIAAALFAPAALALLATGQASTEQAHARAREATPLPSGLIAFIALVVLLQVAGSSVVNIFFNVYLDDGLGVPTAWIGTLAAVGRLVAVPAALATPLLVARWGIGRTIVLGILGMALALLPLALIPHWGAAGLGYMGVVALFALTMPAFAICQQEIVPPGWRATMAGAIAMTTGLSTAAVAFGGGQVITAFGYQALFLISAGLTATGATLLWAFTWLPRYVILRQVELDTTARAWSFASFRSFIRVQGRSRFP